MSTGKNLYHLCSTSSRNSNYSLKSISSRLKKGIKSTQKNNNTNNNMVSFITYPANKKGSKKKFRIIYS